MTVAARWIRDHRRNVVWWSVGLMGLIAFTAAFYPTVKGQADFERLFRDLPPAVRAFVGTREDISITSPPGYLQARMYGSLLPVLLIVFGVGQGARAIGGSEDVGTLELLLANPVARVTVAWQRFAALVALMAVLVAVTVVGLLAISPPFGMLDGVSVPKLVGATAIAGLLGLIHGSIAFCTGCVTGRRGPAIALATAVAVAGFLAQGIFEAAGIEGWVRELSPWQWYLGAEALTGGPTLGSVALPVALSAVLATAGIAVLRGRDLR